MKKLIFILVFICVSINNYSQVIIPYYKEQIDTTEYCYIDSIVVNYEATYNNVIYEGNGFISTGDPIKLFELKNGLTYIKIRYNKDHTKCYFSRNYIKNILINNGVNSFFKIDYNEVYEVREGTTYIIYYYENKKYDKVNIIKYDKVRNSIRCFRFDN